MRSLVAGIAGILIAFSAPGQSKHVASFEAASEIVNVAVDRAGDFYITLGSGILQKFDKNGVILGTFDNKSVPTLFDPTNALRLFIYNHGPQKFAWLSPDLGENPFQTLDPSLAVEPALLCPSGDLNMWVLDQADFSLRRFNPKDQRVLSEFSIRNLFSPATSFSWMREYQNFLFLLDPETGIHIFNYLGKPIKKIDKPHLLYFNFLGEELYYLDKDTLQFVDLFTAETRQMKLEKPARFVLLTDERMITVVKNKVDIFEFIP